MQLNKILRYICIGGLFLLPILPYFVSRTMFFPFITGKNFAFRIIVEIILASWLLLAVRDPRYRPKSSILALSVALFLVVIVVADIFGVNPAKSFWSNFERMEGFVGLVHVGAFFFVAGAVLTAEKLWSRFFHWSFIMATVVAFYGVLQLLGLKDINQGGVRVDATLGNATYLGIYSLLHIFIALFYLLRHQSKKIWFYVYIAFIALQSVILYFTASRGVMVGLVGGLILTALVMAFSTGKEVARLKRGAVYALVGLGILMGLFFGLRNTDFVKHNDVLSRFGGISLKEMDTRFMVWGMAWKGFQERPILGWGQENFDVVFNKYYDPGMYSQEAWFDHAHNTVLDWMIAGGVIGLLAYLFIFMAAMLVLWRKKDGAFSYTDKAVFTGLFAAYFLQSLVVFDNITSYMLFFSVLAFIHGNNTNEKVYFSSMWAKLNTHGLFDRIVAPLVIVGLVFSLYFVNIRSISASRALIQGISQQSGGLSENIEYFEKALRLSTIGRAEVREQLLELALEARGVDGLDESLKLSTLEFAEREMRKQVAEHPLSARHHFFLGTFLRRLGMRDEALDVFKKAVELSPQKQLILFEIALTHLDREEYDKSLEYFKRAYDAESDFAQARLFYGIAAIYAGRIDIVDEVYVPVYGDRTPDNDYVLRAYYDTDRHADVLPIWQKRVEREPENAKYRLSLGAAFLAIGDLVSTRREVEKAAELDPSLKEQAGEILRELR